MSNVTWSHQVIDQPAELDQVELAVGPLVVLLQHLDRARHAEVHPEVAQRVPQLAVVEEAAVAIGRARRAVRWADG